MIRRPLFFILATCVIWLVVCLPLSILALWLFNPGFTPTLLLSFFTAVPLALYMWFSIQSATLKFKWPVLQLIGLTTILGSVLVAVSPLHFFLSAAQIGLIALLIWVLVSIYAAFTALHVKDTFLSINSDKLSQQYRIVHLSDIHAGSRSPEFVRKIVTQTNNHQPDAVVITGDLLDSSEVDSVFLSALSHLKAPAWMSLGNHERYVDLANAVAAIQKHGVTILRNQTTRFKELQIIGIDDTDNPKEAAHQLSQTEISSTHFSLLLYHRPDIWPNDNAVDLTLAGHTHAGQIWPFGLLVKRQFPNMAGYFKAGNSQLFVSQGTGTWGPTLRLGTKSEMTVIDLAPKI